MTNLSKSNISLPYNKWFRKITVKNLKSTAIYLPIWLSKTIAGNPVINKSGVQ